MIKLANQNTCTGCHACKNVCPKHAISMVEDSEGFLQPFIDTDICIECGLCQKTCPVISPLRRNEINQKVYAFINYTDREKSSSGGAFSFFARKILSQGGVVFGAYMDEKLHVRHVSIESLDELDRLRGSKYIQSKIGDTYAEAKKLLRSGRKVLFTGTPCQISGLYKYLGQRWADSLITLDIVCHGVPNQKIFDTYLQKLIKIKNFAPKTVGNIIGFRFRNLDSWSIVPAVKIAKSKTWLILSQEANIYMAAFFRGLTFRRSCFTCQYANTERVGTFTIADFWGVGSIGKKFKEDVSSGVSLLIDNYGQLDKFISSEDNIYVEERSLDEARLKNENLNRPIAKPAERDSAIQDILNPELTLLDYAKKYKMLDSLPKHLVKTIFKKVIYALRLYNAYKTISYKLGRTS